MNKSIFTVALVGAMTVALVGNAQTATKQTGAKQKPKTEKAGTPASKAGPAAKGKPLGKPAKKTVPGSRK